MPSLCRVCPLPSRVTWLPRLVVVAQVWMLTPRHPSPRGQRVMRRQQMSCQQPRSRHRLTTMRLGEMRTTLWLLRPHPRPQPLSRPYMQVMRMAVLVQCGPVCLLWPPNRHHPGCNSTHPHHCNPCLCSPQATRISLSSPPRSLCFQGHSRCRGRLQPRPSPHLSMLPRRHHQGATLCRQGHQCS